MSEEEPPHRHEIRKKGDWICTACGELAYAFRTRCRRCGTAKPGGDADEDNTKHDEDKTCFPAASNVDVAHNRNCGEGRDRGRNSGGGRGAQGYRRGGGGRKMPKPFDWLCESCGDVVWASRMECRCGAPKPRHPIEIGPDGKFPEGTEIPGQSGASQLVGSPDDGSGGYKQRYGHHGRYRDGDWICPNCGDKCFSSRTKCRFCDAAKPPPDQLVLVTSATALVNDGEVEVREGDWPCPRCNRTVWRRHAVCLCGEPKPN